jgi:hypothetical protein
MKRFINISSQYYSFNDNKDLVFAWLDTITDSFERHSDAQIWTSWEDFEQDFEGKDIERYRRLYPRNLP